LGHFPDFPASFSVDFLSGLDAPNEEADPLGSFFEPKPGNAQQALPRSQSVDLRFRFQ
jgi:hypothetical protein